MKKVKPRELFKKKIKEKTLTMQLERFFLYLDCLK